MEPLPLDPTNDSSYSDIMRMLGSDNNKSMSAIEREIFELENDIRDAGRSIQMEKSMKKGAHVITDSESSIGHDLNLLDASMASMGIEVHDFNNNAHSSHNRPARRRSSIPLCHKFLEPSFQFEVQDDALAIDNILAIDNTADVLDAAYTALEVNAPQPQQQRRQRPLVRSVPQPTSQESIITAAYDALNGKHDTTAPLSGLPPPQPPTDTGDFSLRMSRLSNLMSKTAHSQEALRVYENNNPQLPVNTRRIRRRGRLASSAGQPLSKRSRSMD